MRQIDKDIEDQRKRVREASNEHTRESSKLRELRMKRVWLDYGLELGSRVVDDQGREFEVASIDPGSEGSPWVYGRKIKKDGEPSKNTQNVWEWKVKG